MNFRRRVCKPIVTAPVLGEHAASVLYHLDEVVTLHGPRTSSSTFLM